MPQVCILAGGGTDSDIILMLWEYQLHEIEPVWPPPLDEQYPEIALRGLATMIPGLKAYFNRSPRPVLDGGYYTKTCENRPLIGPSVEGATDRALSGYGLMAPARPESFWQPISAHLATYAPAFTLDRYDDPAYQPCCQLGRFGPVVT
jgi:hypothetical protein